MLNERTNCDESLIHLAGGFGGFPCLFELPIERRIWEAREMYECEEDSLVELAFSPAKNAQRSDRRLSEMSIEFTRILRNAVLLLYHPYALDSTIRISSSVARKQHITFVCYCSLLNEPGT